MIVEGIVDLGIETFGRRHDEGNLFPVRDPIQFQSMDQDESNERIGNRFPV